MSYVDHSLNCPFYQWFDCKAIADKFYVIRRAAKRPAINGMRDITAETAVLLSRVLKSSAQFWMNLQTARDLYKASQKLTDAA